MWTFYLRVQPFCSNVSFHHPDHNIAFIKSPSVSSALAWTAGWDSPSLLLRLHNDLASLVAHPFIPGWNFSSLTHLVAASPCAS